MARAKQDPKRRSTSKGKRPKLSKNKGDTSGVKTPHRYRPGTVALREIRRYQKSTDLLIKKAPFCRFVKELLQDTNKSFIRVTTGAMEALHQAAEDFIVKLFEDINLLAIHAKRITIQPRVSYLITTTKIIYINLLLYFTDIAIIMFYYYYI